MMKHLAIVNFVFLLFFLNYSPVEASIVTVTQKGEVNWNVLAYQDEIGLAPKRPSSLEIKKVTNSNASVNPQVELKSDNGKVLLSVNNGSQTQSVDVTELKNTLVEIEQTNPAEKVEISIEHDSFNIKQQGITAVTSYPITISPKDKAFSVSTDTGLQYITLLPSDAVDTVLRPKIITTLPSQRVDLVNRGNEGLAYQISGEKIIIPFNLFSYRVPVTAYVSASNGELIEVIEPNWFRVVGFLFT